VSCTVLHLLVLGVVYGKPELTRKDILKLKSELNERGVESDDSVWHALGEDYASELNDAQELNLDTDLPNPIDQLSEIISIDPIEEAAEIVNIEEITNINKVKNLIPLNKRKTEKFLRSEGLFGRDIPNNSAKNSQLNKGKHAKRVPKDEDYTEDEEFPVQKEEDRTNKETVARILKLFDIDSLNDIESVIPIKRITKIPNDNPYLKKLLAPLENEIKDEDYYEKALEDKYKEEEARLKAIEAVQKRHKNRKDAKLRKLEEIKKILGPLKNVGEIESVHDVESIHDVQDIKEVISMRDVEEVTPLRSVQEIARIIPLTDRQAERLKQMASEVA